MPLEQVLVEHSTYDRRSLKPRLFQAGLKDRRCEQCGQGEALRAQHPGQNLPHLWEQFRGGRAGRTSCSLRCRVAVGAKYGVSDDAVRKWTRRHEAEERDVGRSSTAL